MEDRRRNEENIEIDLKGIGGENLGWINLAQDMGQCQAHGNKAMGQDTI